MHEIHEQQREVQNQLSESQHLSQLQIIGSMAQPESAHEQSHTTTTQQSIILAMEESPTSDSPHGSDSPITVTQAFRRKNSRDQSASFQSLVKRPPRPFHPTSHPKILPLHLPTLAVIQSQQPTETENPNTLPKFQSRQARPKPLTSLRAPRTNSPETVLPLVLEGCGRPRNSAD